MAQRTDIFLLKALESLHGAQSEYSNRRFNSSASRSYDACLQAATAVLLEAGVVPHTTTGQLRHAMVHAQFVGEMISRRHLFSADLRNTLALNLALRQVADYEEGIVTRTQASRALRRSEDFVDAATRRGGARP